MNNAVFEGIVFLTEAGFDITATGALHWFVRFVAKSWLEVTVSDVKGLISLSVMLILFWKHFGSGAISCVTCF